MHEMINAPELLSRKPYPSKSAISHPPPPQLTRLHARGLHHVTQLVKPTRQTLLVLNERSILCRFQELPLARDTVRGKPSDDAVCDLLKLVSSQGQNCRPRSRQADTKQAWLRARVHRLEDFRQAGNERLAVGLVDLVLHGEIDHIRVRRRRAQGCRKQGCPLEIEDL